MMEQASKKRRKKLKKNHLFLIVSIVVILIGTLAFVLAYGLSAGWAALGQWFGSKWAIMLYIGIGIWLVFAAVLLGFERIKKLWKTLPITKK